MPDVDYLSLYSANDHVVLWPDKLNAAEQVLCVCLVHSVCECVCEWALMWVFVFGLACVCWTILKSIKLANSSACKTWPKANTCGPRQLTQHTHTVHTHIVHTHTHPVTHTHTPVGLCAHLKARLFIEDCDSRWPQQMTRSLALPLFFSLSPSLSLTLSFSLCPSPSSCAP